MQATEVLEIINNAVRFMTEDELRVYEAARTWKGRGVCPGNDPVSILGTLGMMAGREIREEAVRAKLGATAKQTAALINRWMLEDGQRDRFHAGCMGMVNGEELQLCMFCSVCMVGLREKNDLVNMTDDETVGADLAKIMTTFQNKPGQNLVTFNSSDVVAAAKMIQANGRKVGKKTLVGERTLYDPIKIAGTCYRAQYVNDLLKIIGDQNMRWYQDKNPLRGAYIETDKGIAILCPVKPLPDAKPVEIECEVKEI